MGVLCCESKMNSSVMEAVTVTCPPEKPLATWREDLVESVRDATGTCIVVGKHRPSDM